MRGRFDEALEKLEEVDQEALRRLNVYQYWSTYIGLLKVRRAIHRSVNVLPASEHIIATKSLLEIRGDISSADTLLEQLAASPLMEPDCALEIALAKIDLQTRRGNFSTVLIAVWLKL